MSGIPYNTFSCRFYKIEHRRHSLVKGFLSYFYEFSIIKLGSLAEHFTYILQVTSNMYTNKIHIKTSNFNHKSLSKI